MSDEISNENGGEGSGNSATTEDILPLFFTSKTQQIFGCTADEDVTAENPHKLIPKGHILQDFKERAAVSDFHPAKKIILEYPGEEVLVVYDADFKYGQNFYLCTTEECKERILHPELAAGGSDDAVDELGEITAEEEIVVWKGPTTPRPWESQGSELEVQDEKTVETRPKIKICISRKRCEFGVPVKFADQSEKAMKDSSVECLPFEDETYLLKKCQMDIGTQAVPAIEEKANQTDWKRPRNACVQYEARFLPEEKRVEAEEAPNLLQFIENVTPRFQLALQQNEIMDVFYDDYVSLADEDSTFGSKSDNYLKEYQSFTDLLYSKEKVITNTEWHPTAKGIIAVSCAEQMSFDERVENASRIIMTPSLILMWSFSDPIHPQLLLEAPDDIFSFKFNPSEPTIIAGGCVNGQVVLWDISSWNDRLLTHRQTAKAKKNTMTSLPGFEDDSNTDHTPIVRYCAVSAIEHSHKSAVTDLQWIPDHMEIGRMGVVVENKSSYCHQLLTCAADGSILFWDTRPTKSAHQSQMTSVQKPALSVTNALKQLDLSWKPILKVTVSHITGSGEFGPTKFSLAEKHGDKSSIKQPDNDKEAASLNRTVSITSKKDQGKILENIATMLFVGTESGDVVYMDWRLSKDSDSGKFTVSKPELVLAAHEGLVSVLQRSPFFKDILLSIGGWTFAIWKEGVSTGPILESASFPVRLTAGTWSPTRPGVFFVTRSDGNVDVWDLLDKSHQPSLTQNVTSASITSLNPFQVSSKQQLLSIGDNVGTLHIMEVPWNLRRPSVNEKNIIENFFEREVSRLKFFEERKKIRAMETMKNTGNEKPKEKLQVDAKKLIEEQESEWEAKARQQYQEYLEMEKHFLEELGLRESDND